MDSGTRSALSAFFTLWDPNKVIFLQNLQPGRNCCKCIWCRKYLISVFRWASRYLPGNPHLQNGQAPTDDPLFDACSLCNSYYVSWVISISPSDKRAKSFFINSLRVSDSTHDISSMIFNASFLVSGFSNSLVIFAMPILILQSCCFTSMHHLKRFGLQFAQYTSASRWTLRRSEI